MLPARLERLAAAPSIHRLPLRRLTPIEIRDALRTAQPELAPEKLDQLVTAVDGLPLVLDEFIRQLRESTPGTDELDMRHTTLAAAVQLRLTRVSPETRVVLDAMAVLGETDAELLAAVTGLNEAALSTALRDGVTSTLLVTPARRWESPGGTDSCVTRFRICCFPWNSRPWRAAPPTTWSTPLSPPTVNSIKRQSCMSSPDTRTRPRSS